MSNLDLIFDRYFSLRDGDDVVSWWVSCSTSHEELVSMASWDTSTLLGAYRSVEGDGLFSLFDGCSSLLVVKMLSINIDPYRSLSANCLFTWDLWRLWEKESLSSLLYCIKLMKFLSLVGFIHLLRSAFRFLSDFKWDENSQLCPLMIDDRYVLAFVVSHYGIKWNFR